MVIEESSIPLKFFRGLDGMSLSKQSLYRALRKTTVRVWRWADEVIEALPTTREELALLTILKRASVLSVSQTIMTTEETPIEVACSRYRGNRYG